MIAGDVRQEDRVVIEREGGGPRYAGAFLEGRAAANVEHERRRSIAQPALELRRVDSAEAPSLRVGGEWHGCSLAPTRTAEKQRG